MQIDYSKKADSGSKPSNADFYKQLEELKMHGMTPDKWPTQYLLWRHDNVSHELGYETAFGAAIDEIESHIEKDMAELEKTTQYIQSKDGEAARRSGIDVMGIAQSRYQNLTVGLDGPSAPGTPIKDMPLYEAIKTYSDRHPGIIRQEVTDKLPGYSEYAAKLDAESGHGREVSPRLKTFQEFFYPGQDSQYE